MCKKITEVDRMDLGNHIEKGPVLYKGQQYEFQSYYCGESNLGYGYVMIDYKPLGEEDEIIVKGVITDDYVTIDFTSEIPVIIPEE